jgi:hypothetical protein
LDSPALAWSSVFFRPFRAEDDCKTVSRHCGIPRDLAGTGVWRRAYSPGQSALRIFVSARSKKPARRKDYPTKRAKLWLDAEWKGRESWTISPCG